MEYRLKASSFTQVFILSSVLVACGSSEVPRPRGVSLSRAPLYNPTQDFTCFDGSLTIPFTQVNDDYCDCPDASDEPGTAACPNGSFHCTNAGHKPRNIPSYRVKDGVCDCCDASDEYGNMFASCINNCNELGRSAREEAQKQAELLKAGKQIRGDFIQRSAQLKQEKKEMLNELEKSLSEAEKLKAEKEQLKNKIEELENAALAKYREIEEAERKERQEEEDAKNRQEATENFKLFDSNNDGKLDLSELKTRQAFDKDKNGEVTDEETRYFLNDKDEIELEEFVTSAWGRVKPFLMLDAGVFKPPVVVDEKVEGAEDVDEDNIERRIEDDINGEDSSQAEDFDYQERDDTETDTEDHEDEEEEEEEEEPHEEMTPEPTTKYDDETQKLIDEATDARKEYDDAEKETRHIQAEIKKLAEYLEKDFGIEDEFATLEGECFEYEDYEYIYRLCPFDKTVQKPKSNSLETRLGIWSSWVGPDHDKYSVMLYDRGQSCWNGPQRTTHVRVTCGSDNRLTAVSEPNRCEYLFDFTTPAACRDLEEEPRDDLHDEL